MVLFGGLACVAGGIGAPRTDSACKAATLKLDFAVEEAQKLQVGALQNKCFCRVGALQNNRCCQVGAL